MKNKILLFAMAFAFTFSFAQRNKFENVLNSRKLAYAYKDLKSKDKMDFYQQYYWLTKAEELRKFPHLEEIKPRLTILARAITGKAIELFPAEREGGYKNNNFFLPIYFNEFASKEANLGFYFFRILFLSVQSELKINLMNFL